MALSQSSIAWADASAWSSRIVRWSAETATAASRCGQVAPLSRGAREVLCGGDEEGRRDGLRGTPFLQHPQVGDHRRQSFVGEVGLRPAGLEHPLQHRHRQLVHLLGRCRCRAARPPPARRRPARTGSRRRRPAVPRSSSRPARMAARRRGARSRPPASPPPPRSCWAGGHPARNPGSRPRRPHGGRRSFARSA